MKVFNLQCEHGHGFEGWFGSEEDYQSQTEQGLLSCPLCETHQVQRLPSAPRLSLGHHTRPAAPEAPTKTTPPATPPATPEHQKVQEMWLQAVRHVLANTEDVGPHFADEARKIHYGESEHRNIRGQTSRDEMQSLAEEGVEVFSMPIPAALKGTIQ
jgi:hypothetical protein